jgi:hypothetical protein
MTLEPHIIYLDGQPRAITMAKDVEHAMESYRLASLGNKDPNPPIVTIENAWSAPIEDVMRVGMLGIYARMFGADLAAVAQSSRKH